MTSERRYQDHEIREILDLAIDEDSSLEGSVTAADGLTLRQLQEVGQEVGVSPDRMAQAAGVVAARRRAPTHETTRWLPTSVERTIPLPRNLSEINHTRDIACDSAMSTRPAAGSYQVGASTARRHAAHRAARGDVA
jgi:hypothetical protein